MLEKVFKNIPATDKSAVIAYLAKLIVNVPKVICLYGELGAGKTALAAEFINHISVSSQEVTSPTFNIVHTYSTLLGELWHLDLYRLSSIGEVYNLGFEEALDSKLLIIEWPQLIEHLLPADTIKVYIEFSVGGEARDYSIMSNSS